MAAGKLPLETAPPLPRQAQRLFASSSIARPPFQMDPEPMDFPGA